MGNEIVCVILAAGKGSRMYPFNERYPKPILPICNKSLLEHQIEIIKELDISEVIIVIGYLGYQISKILGEGEKLGLKIRYVEQEETLGIAHAVGKLESIINSPFFLLLGDIFFITDDLSPMVKDIRNKGANAVLATKIEHDREAIKRNFAVIADKRGIVKRTIEKPRYITSNIKGCGLYLFDLHIFDAIRRTPRTAMRDEYELTDAIQILIDDGYRVKHRNLIKEDVNLTYAWDLFQINMKELKRRNISRMIGRNVQMPKGTVINNSIIGDDVTVQNPIRISNSIIFSGSTIASPEYIEGLIITPYQIIDYKNRFA